MITYAIDFESYYDNKLSTKIQGAVNYASLVHIYGVSVFGPDVSYVGCLEDAPWKTISGHHWVSHNAGFDQAVFNAAIEKGQIPDVMSGYSPDPDEWDCTADLCAYLGIGRSLKDCVKIKYNVEISKDARTDAKGKRWPKDFTEAQQKEMNEYALSDAKWCWKLWADMGVYWPTKEIELSRITRQRCLQGIYVNSPSIIESKDKLEDVMKGEKAKIPWSDSGVILSHPRLQTYCESVGIPAPSSLAENDEDCAKWEGLYGAMYPVVGAIRNHRKANIMLKKLESMEARTMVNGRMHFELKYFGAHTGRFSGSGGLNMQNLPRDPLFDVDLRSVFIPGPGKKFIICDLAQIEPRITAWVVKDTEMLESMRQGFGIYEAFAKSTGVWEGDAGTLKATDKELYALSKAQVLALGYGCGPEKFIYMAKMYADMVLSLAQSKPIVKGYRSKNPLITRTWDRLDREMRHCAAVGEDYELELPSGRCLRYTSVQLIGGLKARQGFSGLKTHYWGGKLLENLVQATARDVLAEGILRLEANGIPVVFSAHDEVICEVAEDLPVSMVKNLMVEAPEWMPGIPLEAEAIESYCYTK